MNRLPWVLLIALCIGFGIGLCYAWVVAPARVADITPDTLRSDFKDQYRVAIASAYVATGNMSRARARLALLGDANPVSELAAQAQRSLAAREAPKVAQDLARLAADLSGAAPDFGQVTSEAAAPSPSVVPTLEPARTPTSPSVTLAPDSAAAPTASQLGTPIVPPTQAPVATPRAPFVLLSQDPVCNSNLTSGLLQITVLDRARQPMPGIEIAITWDAGEEHFFTGLKPEIGLGYADFIMQPGTAYSLLVARSGSPVSGLSSPTCPRSGGQPFFGGLKLTFRQP